MKYMHLFLACFIVNIGIYLLHSAEIATGGTIGLALSISYWTKISFPVIYFFINLPFFILSWRKIGRDFTLSTLLAIIIVSSLSYLTSFLPTLPLPTLVGGILGSMIAGIGVIYLFLNQSSLGGTSIFSIYLQQKYTLDPGKTLFVLDCLILITTLYSIGWIGFIYSVMSAFIVSTMVSIYRKRINQQFSQSKEPITILKEEANDLPLLQ